MELKVPRIGAKAALLGAALALALMAFAAPAQAHVPFCEETVNPHGQNVPPAGSTTLPGPRGGINEDGFYRVGTDTGTDVRLEDTDGNVFGIFPSGTKVKYTEANGATPSVKKIGSDNGQAGAVDFHIKGTGDLVVFSVVEGSSQVCPVPPPPK
jgi:opacity protein-like surface antigen